jgi:pilus assembly protein CpaE
MDKPKVLVVAEEQTTQSAVAGALKDLASVLIVATSDRSVIGEHDETSPSMVVVAVSKNPEASLAIVTELAAVGAWVLVIGKAKDPDLILGAMRAGAREFLLESDIAGLRRAFQEQTTSEENKGPGGTVITVFPTRGGIGTTCIVTNLAHAIQRTGDRVCLVDLDLHLGDVLSFLDLPGTYSITDVLANIGRLDQELLDASINKHASGVRVLAQSGKVEEADRIRPAEITQLLGFLRKYYNYVLVDGVRGFDEMAIAALDASQKILMVLTQDVPAVRNAKRCLDLFRRLGYSDSKPILVLNRYHKDSEITTDVIQDMIGLPVTHTLSNDFQAAIGSINRGVPLQVLMPRSHLTKDIENLVPILASRSTKPATRPGFLRGLLSRRNEHGPSRAT